MVKKGQVIDSEFETVPVTLVQIKKINMLVYNTLKVIVELYTMYFLNVF